MNGSLEKMKNPWYARFKHALYVSASAIVVLGNYWVDGPEWLFVIAPVAAVIIVSMTGEAPKYRNPQNNLPNPPNNGNFRSS